MYGLKNRDKQIGREGNSSSREQERRSSENVKKVRARMENHRRKGSNQTCQKLEWF